MFFPTIDPTATAYTNTHTGATYYKGPGNVWTQSNTINATTRAVIKEEIAAELQSAIDARPTITKSETLPTEASNEGDLWWDTDDLTLKVYHFDGNSYQWVAV